MKQDNFHLEYLTLKHLLFIGYKVLNFLEFGLIWIQPAIKRTARTFPYNVKS
jgi:hypothetical protein